MLRWLETIVQTLLPGWGDAFCLPTSVENPAILTAPDVPDLAMTPHALSQDNWDIGMLGVVVLFQLDPAPQGTEGRSRIAPSHATPGDNQMDNSEGVGCGTQATVPSEDANIDAHPNLTQIEMEDGGNGGGGGDPVTQGRGSSG